jgi:hypothetical protein
VHTQPQQTTAHIKYNTQNTKTQKRNTQNAKRKTQNTKHKTQKHKKTQTHKTQAGIRQIELSAVRDRQRVTADPARILAQMRKDRCKTVQRPEQFAFVVRSLLRVMELVEEFAEARDGWLTVSVAPLSIAACSTTGIGMPCRPGLFLPKPRLLFCFGEWVLA